MLLEYQSSAGGTSGLARICYSCESICWLQCQGCSGCKGCSDACTAKCGSVSKS